eukprot:4797702-Pyramimonas_sp.AAC.1
MKCGTQRERAPAWDFLDIHSQTRRPSDTSTILKHQEPKNDDSYRFEDDPLGTKNMKCGPQRERAQA